MDFENERAVLSAHFTDFWNNQTVQQPAPPVQWNNQPFTQPDNAAWVRFSIIPVTTNPAAIGGIIVRTVGIVAIQLFLPGTTGVTLARKMADAIAEKYNFLALAMTRGYIHFQTCAAEDYGHNDGFYQMNANIPYWRDTVRVGPGAPIDGGTFANTPGNNIDGGGFTD